ncbi:MAG: hypothetical protein ACXVP3_08270, partial [Actinomycetota bacterium]
HLVAVTRRRWLRRLARRRADRVAPWSIDVDDTVALPDGSSGTVVDVYDDEYGREGGVAATLAVDEG